MITEPMTMATDYLLAVAAAFFAYSLIRRSRPVSRSNGLWAAGFLFIGIAALTGGTFHGFTLMLAPPALSALWKVTCYAVGIGSLSMLLATADAYLPKWWIVLVSTAALVSFAIHAVKLATRDDFLIVVIHYGVSMTAILVIALVEFLRRRSASSRWIIGGVAVSFLAAGIQAGGIALHRHFNHNDLYHVVQIAGLWMLYRGAEGTSRVLSDPPATSRSTIRPM